MDESRLQAYLKLIQALLECPGGEEVKILNASLDLVDAEFVEITLKISVLLRQQGKQDDTNRLMYIAGVQLGVYENSTAGASPQQYLKFLNQILHTIIDSKGNKKVRAISF